MVEAAEKNSRELQSRARVRVSRTVTGTYAKWLAMISVGSVGSPTTSPPLVDLGGPAVITGKVGHLKSVCKNSAGDTKWKPTQGVKTARRAKLSCASTSTLDPGEICEEYTHHCRGGAEWAAPSHGTRHRGGCNADFPQD